MSLVHLDIGMPPREFNGLRTAGVQLMSQDCRPVDILVLKGSEASFSGQDSLSFSFPEDVSPIMPFLSTAWNTGSSSKGPRWLLSTQEAVHPGTMCYGWEGVIGLLPQARQARWLPEESKCQGSGRGTSWVEASFLAQGFALGVSQEEVLNPDCISKSPGGGF